MNEDERRRVLEFRKELQADMDRVEKMVELAKRGELDVGADMAFSQSLHQSYKLIGLVMALRHVEDCVGEERIREMRSDLAKANEKCSTLIERAADTVRAENRRLFGC